MLSLIALANVGWWAAALGARTFDSQFDGVLTLLRVVFVDQRAYPLFAMLFGFGLMTLVQRRRERYIEATVNALAQQGYVDVDPSSGVTLTQLLDKDATKTARRLLVNRALWMLVIGAVHGLLFPGDIIGTYALICLAFAWSLAKGHYRLVLVVGSLLAAFMLTVLSLTVYFDPAAVAQAAHPAATLDYSFSTGGLGNNAVRWLMIAVGAALGSLAVLGTGVGAWLATTDIVSRPDQHRRQLEVMAAGGLLFAFLGGLPYGLVEAEMLNMKAQWWMYPLNQIAGFVGALGWLSLLLAFAGPAPMLGSLRGVRWVLAAVGRRSMTSYLLQSVLFAAIFVPLSAQGVHISELSGVCIAMGVWLVTVVFAVTLEFLGRQGPAEWLIRSLVRRTSRPVKSSVFPERLVWVAR